MEFAAVFIALYVGHHVGDYWIQTDCQARRKGDAGVKGIVACLSHVYTYVLTQWFAVIAMMFVTGQRPVGDIGWAALIGALLFSGITHYLADRREHGIMFKLARKLPGKAAFLTLGVPREGRDDNPSLGTGGWALDQSWHIALGCFIPALIMTIKG